MGLNKRTFFVCETVVAVAQIRERIKGRSATNPGILSRPLRTSIHESQYTLVAVAILAAKVVGPKTNLVHGHAGIAIVQTRSFEFCL